MNQNKQADCAPNQELCTDGNQGASSGQELPRVAPKQTVRETEDGWRIRVELPGVAPEDMTLEVQSRVLTLEAKPLPLPADGEARTLTQGFHLASFSQRWKLPARVDLDSIATQYRHGLLTIELPYRAPERRKIEVTVE